MTRSIIVSLTALLLLFVACRGAEDAAPAHEPMTLRLATTTSVEHSGLTGVLLPALEAATGLAVQVVAVGTGQALALARNGDVDAVLVHDKAAELKFIEDGSGVNRRRVMHNDFVIVGPAGDPAGVRGEDDAIEVFRLLGSSHAPFLSRGDASGTHRAEQRLWELAEVETNWPGYMESGQGQRPNLIMASEKQAYCMLDRATWLSAMEQVDLELLVEGDPRMYNPYSVIAVNPARFPDARYVEAMIFIGWITSAKGQALIDEFRVKGVKLFHPDAVPVR